MNTPKKLSFFGVMRSYNGRFWVASMMELFERWAWYGLFAVLALYLTGSTDEGGLGFTHTEKGQIMGIVTAILYLLPLLTGVIADKIGYKLSLIIAYLLLISGYYIMGEVKSYPMVFAVFLWVAVGAAMFKPVAFGHYYQKHRRFELHPWFRHLLHDGKYWRLYRPGLFLYPAHPVWLEDYLSASGHRDCHQPDCVAYFLQRERTREKLRIGSRGHEKLHPQHLGSRERQPLVGAFGYHGWILDHV